MKSEARYTLRARAVLAAVALFGAAAALLVTGSGAAQAAQGTGAPAAAVTLAARAPLAAARAAASQTIVLAPGVARVSTGVGGAHFEIARPAGISPRVTCTLTAYYPEWFYDAPNPSGILGSAGVSCDSDVSYIAGAVGLYLSDGALLGDNTAEDTGTNALYLEYLYPVLASGYYSTGAVGEVGDPIDGEFSEVYSPQIYVTAPNP
jgi:hypothetical protein